MVCPTGRRSAFPATSGGFWKESLTFSTQALVCGMWTGSAWALMTLADQEAVGPGLWGWCFISSICKAVTERRPR